MEFTLFELLRAFGFSVILGFALAAVYEPVRLLHKLGLSKPIHYFVCDTAFMIIASFVTYLFCLVYIEGSVRLFVIVGETLGFFAFYFSVRRLLDRIYAPFINFFKKNSAKLLKIGRKIMYNILNSFKRMCMKIKDKVNIYVSKKRRKPDSSKRIRKYKNN